MGLDAAFVAGGVLALVLGYRIHRWWLLVGLVVVGIGVIVLDVSARDLTGAGHDDRGLVAAAEAFLLIVVLGLVSAGIAVGKWRGRRIRSHPEPSG